MSSTPQAVEKLIQELCSLPGLGPKSAERIAYWLLKQPHTRVDEFLNSIKQALAQVIICAVCQRWATASPCEICRDARRDATILCVVAESHNISVIEKTNAFHGRYHVLGGTLSALEGITPEQLKTKELEARLNNNGIKEVLLALNPDIDGETTALYLAKLIKPLGIKISKLARGLPVGADLDYADEVTLESAITERKEL